MNRQLFTLFGACLLTGSASAVLNFNLNVNALTTMPGSNVVFSGTITGVTGDLTLASSFCGNARQYFGGVSLVGDFTAAFKAYLALNTTANYSGTIAEYVVPASTPLGLYDTDSSLLSGSAIVVGGYNARQTPVADNEFFSIEVVPEPASIAALGLGVFGLLRRKRKG